MKAPRGADKLFIVVIAVPRSGARQAKGSGTLQRERRGGTGSRGIREERLSLIHFLSLSISLFHTQLVAAQNDAVNALSVQISCGTVILAVIALYPPALPQGRPGTPPGSRTGQCRLPCPRSVGRWRLPDLRHARLT